MACDDTTNDTHAADGDIFVGYRVVCLIDLLGQKEKLAKWATIPATPQPPEEFTDALRKTVGTVLSVKDMFLKCFRNPAWTALPPMDSVPEGERAGFLAFCQRCKEASVTVQQFADTFVFYAPMLNSYDDVTVAPFLQMLGACCGAMVDSLAAGIPLRGALCIGPGTELGECNFYGPALAEAHHLESELARRPRIVVSPVAVKFAHSYPKFSDDPRVNRTMKNWAQACLSLMYSDDDGNVALDFLGKGMRAAAGDAAPSASDNITKAYHFACSESIRCKQEAIQSRKANDFKLAGRYASLRRYIESRLPIWGLGHLNRHGS